MLFSESLRKTKDFRSVYQQGRSKAGRGLVMYVLSNKETVVRQDPINRVGFSVSKKIGNSVVRHKLIRRLRECYRLNEKRMERGFDIVVVVRPGAREMSFPELERALLNLAERQKITHEVSDH